MYKNCLCIGGGKYLDLLNPTVDMIRIEDIAHSLSQQCRWNGYTNVFYSVAQHSMEVASLVSVEHREWALLHDAAEAYISDLPTPIKSMLPDYQKLEEKLLLVIAEKFRLAWHAPHGYSSEVKVADSMILKMEERQLVLPAPIARADFDAYVRREGDTINFRNIILWPPPIAEQKFMGLAKMFGLE